MECCAYANIGVARSKIASNPLTGGSRITMSNRTRTRCSEAARVAPLTASHEYPPLPGAWNIVSVLPPQLQAARTCVSIRSPLSNGNQHGLCQLQRHPRCRLQSAQSRTACRVHIRPLVHVLWRAAVEIRQSDRSIIRRTVFQRQHSRSALSEPRLMQDGADLRRCMSVPLRSQRPSESTLDTGSFAGHRRKCGLVVAWGCV